jgi:hypothetical protein
MVSVWSASHHLVLAQKKVSEKSKGMNLLSRDKKTKVGMKTKRLKAGWDNRYLEDVLNALNIVII